MTIAPPPGTTLGSMSLAHPSTDPPTLVARVRAALGWSGSDFLVGLRDYDELTATMDAAHDIDGLFRIGDAASPHVRLLRALNASASGLRVTRVADVASPWRWTRVGENTAAIAGVALRQQTYLDVVGSLGRAGVTFRVVPNETTTAELLAVAAPLGSAVVDVDELSHEAATGTGPGTGSRATSGLVPGYLDDLPDLTYGLVSRETPPVVDVVWLVMAAGTEQAGTLMVALEQFSALGMNLDFLHSDPLPQAGPDGSSHDFYVGFHADDARVSELQARLADVGFSSRVLACFDRREGGGR